MTKRLCISVSDDDASFLEIMQLSPSGLLKQRIMQIKEDSTNYKNMIAEREKAIKFLGDEVRRLNEIIEKNGILEQKNN